MPLNAFAVAMLTAFLIHLLSMLARKQGSSLRVSRQDLDVVDEPTSALDLHRQIEVLSLVRRLAKERRMIIMIALHDLNQVLRFSDKVMVIMGGRLHACGTVGEVITPPLLKAVYRVEARIESCSRGERHLIVDGVAGEPALATSAEGPVPA